MNLGDPQLELIDPTPNIHALFLNFDKLFFRTVLMSRTVVRWSKRMFSCAGICYYKGGVCDVALSEPLLKLRPRKDLIETLLHEMIHAYLFITNQDRDRDGHGPNFQKFMHRINQAAGLNISIYHDFHEEVKLYQTHWWRCNGPCQNMRPHFGIVRRSTNRAPGPLDYWFECHQRKCGGTFVKIKEPEKKNKKSATGVTNKKSATGVTNYITNYINNASENNTTIKPVLKASSNIPTKGNIKTTSSATVIVNRKSVIINPTVLKPEPIPVFIASGQTISKTGSNTVDVVETVRNVWASKVIVTNNNNNKASNLNKHKLYDDVASPPAKIQKIDDYFKAVATSVIKDLYGDDIELTHTSDTEKLKAVSGKVNLVDCPICNAKINNNKINMHLDECLNKDIIAELSQNDTGNDSIGTKDDIDKSDAHKKPLGDFVGIVPQISAVNGNEEHVDLTKIKTETDLEKIKEINFENKNRNLHKSFDDSTLFHTKPNKSENTRKSNNFVTNTRGDTLITNKEIKSDEFDQTCPCCGKKYDKPIQEHLDECLIFFDNDNTLPEERPSTSNDVTIIIDDDDCDETSLLNDTGTKWPCPCCMQMIEQADMNDHLDVCLQS